MKLYASTRSPYAHKVLTTLHELDIFDRFEIEYVVVSSLFTHDEMMKINPLGKIPTLVTKDEVFFDSALICDYLDATYGDGKLTMANGPAHWDVARLRALADGIMGNDIFWLIERSRPDEHQSKEMIDACRIKIASVLDALERGDFQLITQFFTSGEIALYSAIAHLEFRFGDEGWFENRPRLTDWYARLSERPSIIAAAYKD